MADKAISELVAASQITATDMFVLEQNGTAKKLTGQVLLNWLTAAADGHGGIQSIDKLRTSGLEDTYRITLADLTTFDFVVTNGRSVNSITRTSTSGLVDTYRINYNDGTGSNFTVTNGAKGDKGDNAYMWIKYASQEPTASSHSFGDVPDAWIGVYFGNLPEAPTDWQQYRWYQWKGEKGDTGEAATLLSAVVTYQTSTSGTIVPSGSWQTNVPVVPPGSYLWTRTVYTFNTGSPVTQYSVARFGIDGTGSVSSVAGISPDPDGNVPLTAEKVGALPSSGGTMTGSINMNGQTLSGLNAPTANDQAANMGFVNQQMRKATPRNLLDNSDFRNPVNQRGLTTYTGPEGAYTIDRWYINSRACKLVVDDGYIHMENSGSTSTATQILFQEVKELNLLSNKTCTLAARVKGSSVRLNANGGITSEYGAYDVFTIILMTFTMSENVAEYSVGVQGSNGSEWDCEWVALYEGEYTAETLPEYQPKGYGVEVVNSNGGAVSMELLWENASPTSSFAAQTVSVDLSEYELCCICIAISKNSSLITSTILPAKLNYGFRSVLPDNSTATKQYFRQGAVTQTGVVFQEGVILAAGATANNDYMIPYRIYGIKGVTA